MLEEPGLSAEPSLFGEVGVHWTNPRPIRLGSTRDYESLRSRAASTFGRGEYRRLDSDFSMEVRMDFARRA